MDKAKKKQIEDRLKQLIKEFDQGENGEASDKKPDPARFGNVQVIRRRKGTSDKKTGS